jgi:hypothetical protein
LTHILRDSEVQHLNIQTGQVAVQIPHNHVSNRLKLGIALKYINSLRKAKAGKGWAKVRKGI